ncbi:MmgE/PrpD family protein [Planifilum fimeticola]|uniref:MmgE/PrpD family protein n=1 Tax=Planifilum fimeticola TaxID=201975 RepID=A0A2T0LF44_9BACL|nr:MmgE/PrpD family protein [Planifilum fimeticola]PRX40614.1 MmgE/PrpD family protein [Planifilum fimeticola]
MVRPRSGGETGGEAFTDVVGCAVAGVGTKVASIARAFSYRMWGAGNSTVILSSEKLSPPGAAWVNATLANALDIDDGHRLTKGHPGAIVFPAVWAISENKGLSGAEFLTALLIGYEIGIRTGIIAHQLRPEYHCTGPWGAVGAAAGGARASGLDSFRLVNALGIAEYFAPYSPMMRCIAVPSMVKDGIGWGSMAGVSAVGLGTRGFPRRSIRKRRLR